MKTATETMMEATKPAVPPLKPLPAAEVAPATWVFAGKWSSVGAWPPSGVSEKWVHAHSDPIVVRGGHPTSKLFALRLIYNMCVLTDTPPNALFMMDAEAVHKLVMSGPLVAYKSLSPMSSFLHTLLYSDTPDGEEFRNNLSVMTNGHGVYAFKDYREFHLDRDKFRPWEPIHRLIDTKLLRIMSPRALLSAHIFPNSSKDDIAAAVFSTTRFPELFGGE